VKHANLAIRERAAREPDKRGMGAAVVAVHATSTGFCLAHVGHTRCYRARERHLERLTEDHTRLTEYVWRGVPLDAALRMPDRAALSRALGTRDHVEVTVTMDDARRGDALLLCSNGLYDALSDREMVDALTEQSDVEATAAALIAGAVARGAPDDATCVVLRFQRKPSFSLSGKCT
jgi:protein phosphatase